MKKGIVWATAVTIICTCLIIYSCNSGNKGNQPGSGNLRVLARNVLFGSPANAATTMRAAGAVDTTTQVLAQNVVIETANNDLNSTDLQSALDNEMAIKLSAYLPGTTWNITNKTSDATFSGTLGVITFSTGTLTVNSGRLAAAGIAAATENTFCDIPLDPVNYELLSDGVMYVTWTGQSRQVQTQTQPQDATITIIARSKDKMVLVGTGGCGAQGIPRISVLTKQPGGV